MDSSFSTPEVSRGAATVYNRVFVAGDDVYHCHSATSSDSSSCTAYVYRKVVNAAADWRCSCCSTEIREITATSSVAVEKSDPSVSRGGKISEMAGLHKMNFPLKTLHFS